MFTRHFCSSCFLHNVFGTEPFSEYCRQRGIALPGDASPVPARESLRRWVSALAQLPREAQARVELELARVSDLANDGSLAQLLRGIEGRELPADTVPGDSALALWFFVRHPEVFHEVFLHEETQEMEAWWHARARPDVALTDLPAKAGALGTGLQEVFRRRECSGRFCAVDARRLDGGCCFVAHVADRLQFLEVFTDGGEYATRALQPALPVIFVYYPLDGTVLLQTRLTARERVLELFQLFARAVLGTDLGDGCMDHAFDLERLKERFDPIPDAPDMEAVRVKSLHFRYPERYGRRQVKFETLLSDQQFAVVDLIQAHMREGPVPNDLRVSYAELQVKLRVEGGTQSHVIRLWPNRCSLNETPLGERLRACLRNWGLYRDHAR